VTSGGNGYTANLPLSVALDVVSLVVSAIAVVLLGVFPGTFVEWAGSIALK